MTTYPLLRNWSSDVVLCMCVFLKVCEFKTLCRGSNSFLASSLLWTILKQEFLTKSPRLHYLLATKQVKNPGFSVVSKCISEGWICRIIFPKEKKKQNYTPINKIWLSAYRWYFIQLIGHFKWGPEAEPVWLFQEDLFSLRKVPFAFLAPGLKNRKDFAGLSWIDILQSYQKLCLSIITYSDVEHVI